MIIISASLLILVLLPLVYLLSLAIAATRGSPSVQINSRTQYHRFAIAIPAHNESTVIQDTIKLILASKYPKEMFSIHVVADNCSDNTSELARSSGAYVHERSTNLKSGKGEALSWLFNRILKNGGIDAVIVFDADTRVHPDFLGIMNSRLDQGDQVIQGQHVISNPHSGWFPALTWAMLLVDNKFQNLGRSNLGLSAKHMGDSICIRSSLLRKLGWGSGLTEDFDLRQKFLLDGVRIVYEPAALGFGEAPLTWHHARQQRSRWLRGVYDVSQRRRLEMVVEGIKARNPVLLDSAFQMYIPSYSTLTLLSIIIFACHLIFNYVLGLTIPGFLLSAWGVISFILFFYPFWGLILEQAPRKAYLAMLSGPFYIIWRTWIAFSIRLSKQPIIWNRTPREGQYHSE